MIKQFKTLEGIEPGDAFFIGFHDNNDDYTPVDHTGVDVRSSTGEPLNFADGAAVAVISIESKPEISRWSSRTHQECVRATFLVEGRAYHGLIITQTCLQGCEEPMRVSLRHRAKTKQT